MELVIGVRFKNAGKIYYFDPSNMDLSLSDNVIVETARGIEYGEVVVEPRMVSPDEIISPLKSVIRKANKDDDRKYKENKNKEVDALAICQKKIADHGLAMNLVEVELTFDNSKIIFYFTANGRIDFR
ncbi:MAG TPA: regulatory iron-sulfur-containing complex subunit RicT, partial [Bacillota bacterium]|nr:regulatory iron-sulfur-containing complex subunit RicT [Bacillota bacterium]